MPREFYLAFLLLNLLLGCSSSRKNALAQKPATPNSLSTLLNDSALINAHVGVLITDAESGKQLAAHNAEKYFVPASNTKIWTMYAAMKHLGEWLVAARYAFADDGIMVLQPNADPSFLHPDFEYQPLDSLLRTNRRLLWYGNTFKEEPYGPGWSWNDYDETYMLPRTALPVYGGEVEFYLEDSVLKNSLNLPSLSSGRPGPKGYSLLRDFSEKIYRVYPGKDTQRVKKPIPPGIVRELLFQRYGTSFVPLAPARPHGKIFTLYSQPTDSILRPLMHRSDNFFAEQILLMASNETISEMNDSKFIAHLLNNDLKEVPQKPRWADGSGLSRYNLFTPTDMVWILKKAKDEFGMERLANILPTGNEGTLSNYYTALQNNLYAKTGTLSGVVALSGFVTATSGKQFIFSVLVNNHNGSATAVRRAVERYILAVVQQN